MLQKLNLNEKIQRDFGNILNQKLKEKKQSISLPLDFKYRVKQS